ncbi:MAG: methionine--tRNA ligase [Bacteroidetes bacterium]|nr:MAG: methionine--tRNA ligase [Bacteroidota bacterium]
MSKTPKRYLITAALPYANGPVHIGHLAGCYLPADIYVRYLKATGKDVVFICGSDEHGVPITIKAKKEGVTPQQVVDKYDGIMKNAFKDFGIDFTYYGRTSSKTHHETAQAFFKTLYDNRVFKEEITQQYFDTEANQFLADRYITGICPRCGNPNAYGDQCEKCGTSLSPTDLINPKSALSGAVPVLKETKNWFLPMGDIQQSDAFQAYIKRFDGWKSNIKGQCQSWLNDGLQSRAMTRDLDWGVPVPIDGADGKVLYVWFDAPIGYISATKEYFKGSNEWEKYWMDEDTALIHFIGKDNIVFHAIIFPMMLMTHGNYILPTNVPANEFLNLEGDKISTSRNWAVWLHEYLIDFPNRQDELRYVLTSIAPETKDSEFTWKDFQTRVNSELVSIFGNFVNRVLVLCDKYYGGLVPQVNTPINDEKLVASRKLCFESITNSLQAMVEDLDAVKLRDAQAEFINAARAGNKYLADTEPWKLVKTDEEVVKAILFDALQICAKLSIAAEPFLPNTAAKLKAMLNAHNLQWNSLFNETLINSGHQLNKAEILYKQVEDTEIQPQLDRLHRIKTENETGTKQNEPNQASENRETANHHPVKPDITYDDFDKIDLRVGKVLEAERVPKADKLLKLTVDLGFEKRTILSGIAEYYQPEELVGKLVTVVANLAPRKIRGIESQGMLLMAGNDFGKLYSVSAEKDIEPGSVVK